VFGLFKSRKHSDVAHALYSAILIQARLPVFYTYFGVQDTVDGRFDMIVLHAHIMFNRLKVGAAEDQDVSQAVFDLMFADMDQNLREMGVGDTGVSIRIKAMAEAFYGRATAYADGLREGDDTILIAALKRNLYRNSKANDEQIEGIAKYVRHQVNHLNSQNLAELNRGIVTFMSVQEKEEGNP
jgi:cytochrome b pre-mRNA-processing protein 3